MDDDELLDELILRAEEGSHEAGRELLTMFILGLYRDRVDPRLLKHVAEGIWKFLKEDVPLERALCVEHIEEEPLGGRPERYAPERLVALYVLLHDYLEYGKEKAINEITEITGASKTTIQRAREKLDLEGHGKRQLLELARPLPEELFNLLKGGS